MTVWGYVPIGDPSSDYLLNRDGFLNWLKTDSKTGKKKSFAIANPAWRANGFPDPVWPAILIRETLVRQEVCQQTGFKDNETPLMALIPAALKNA